MSKPQSQDVGSQTPRNPSEWNSGDEPITTAQRSYLETLAREANESVRGDDKLTKSEAALKIEVLQRKIGRQPRP